MVRAKECGREEEEDGDGNRRDRLRGDVAKMEEEGEPGTIHVLVKQTTNMPTMDFGQAQNPMVGVQYAVEETVVVTGKAAWTTIQWGVGPNCAWNEEDGHLELHWSGQKPKLTIQVNNARWLGQDVLGSGCCTIEDIIGQPGRTLSLTIPLFSANKEERRGLVHVDVYWGPPLRPAIQAIQRLSILLDGRDAIVLQGLCVIECLFRRLPISRLSYYWGLYAPIIQPMLIGSALLVAVLCCTLVTTSMLTFPLWILPLSFLTFFTLPLWLPILLATAGALLLPAFFLLTSSPLRTWLDVAYRRFKSTSIGTRVLYQSSQPSSSSPPPQ